jgi:hypothetical protein
VIWFLYLCIALFSAGYFASYLSSNDEDHYTNALIGAGLGALWPIAWMGILVFYCMERWFVFNKKGGR